MGRHVFITGQPGVGKTTVVRNVVERLRSHPREQLVMTGFYTEELRGDGGRIGFDVVTLSGERGPLARLAGTRKGMPAVGRYAVDVKAFEKLALPQMEPAGQAVVVVDEVGKMELFSGRFRAAIMQVLDAGPMVLGTVPMARHGRTIPQVEEIKGRPDVMLVEITKETRESSTESIFQTVVSYLARH